MLGISLLICLQFLYMVAPGLERIKILKCFKSAVLPCCFLFYFGIFAAGEKKSLKYFSSSDNMQFFNNYECVNYF